MPFLDTDFISLALSVPPELKIVTMPNGRQMEKWVLRPACEDLLPADIVWRTKEQFDEGSGTIELLDEALGPCRGTGVWATPTAVRPRGAFGRPRRLSITGCCVRVTPGPRWSWRTWHGGPTIAIPESSFRPSSGPSWDRREDRGRQWPRIALRSR